MAFANQTAIAIENAILFARVQATLSEITQVKELMENVFASIASGVITSNADDRVMTFNRAAGQILATPPEEALNHLLPELLPRIADFAGYMRSVREQESAGGLRGAHDRSRSAARRSSTSSSARSRTRRTKRRASRSCSTT